MTNYQKGVRKERKFVNEARAEGHIALRSAGSHSPIDVVIIDQRNKQISLLQCKPDNFSASKTEKLMKDYSHLNGFYFVSFDVK